MYRMVTNFNQGEGMKIDGLIVNQLLSRFKEGQAFLVIQNEKGRDIGILNLKSVGLANHFKTMQRFNRKIKLNLEAEKPWKEEQV